jgi:hypothetical protein
VPLHVEVTPFTVHVAAPVVAIVRTVLEATPPVTAPVKVVTVVSTHESVGDPLHAGAHPGPTHVAVQSVQTPLEPQSVVAVPPTHVPPDASVQHPTLHVWVELHAVVHRCDVVSHAGAAAGQSADEVHPQTDATH